MDADPQPGPSGIPTKFSEGDNDNSKLKLLCEDIQQLLTQYEHEKEARKQSEQKLLELEDIAEGERKELSGRLESLECIVGILELKNKNSLEHASRLEERENKLKKEYAELHDTYSQLYKNHMEYIQRTKLLLDAASDRVENRSRMGANSMTKSSGPISCLEGGGMEHAESMAGSPVRDSSSPPTPPLGEEMAAVQIVERSHLSIVTEQNQATSPVTSRDKMVSGRSRTKSEQWSGNTIYQELSSNDTDTNLNESGGEMHQLTGNDNSFDPQPGPSGTLSEDLVIIIEDSDDENSQLEENNRKFFTEADGHKTLNGYIKSVNFQNINKFNLTDYTVYDESGDMRSFSDGYLEMGIKLYFSGIVTSPLIRDPRHRVELRKCGPIIDWHMLSEKCNTFQVVLTTDLGEYSLQTPVLPYAPHMFAVNEKSLFCTQVLDYLANVNTDNASYQQLLDYIQSNLSDTDSTRIGSMLRKHSFFIMGNLQDIWKSVLIDWPPFEEVEEMRTSLLSRQYIPCRDRK